MKPFFSGWEIIKSIRFGLSGLIERCNLDSKFRNLYANLFWQSVSVVINALIFLLYMGRRLCSEVEYSEAAIMDIDFITVTCIHFSEHLSFDLSWHRKLSWPCGCLNWFVCRRLEVWTKSVILSVKCNVYTVIF